MKTHLIVGTAVLVAVAATPAALRADGARLDDPVRTAVSAEIRLAPTQPAMQALLRQRSLARSMAVRPDALGRYSAQRGPLHRVPAVTRSALTDDVMSLLGDASIIRFEPSSIIAAINSADNSLPYALCWFNGAGVTGTAPYTFAWYVNSSFYSTDETISVSMPGSGTVHVEVYVTDVYSESGYADKYIPVGPENGTCYPE